MAGFIRVCSIENLFRWQYFIYMKHLYLFVADPQRIFP